MMNDDCYYSNSKVLPFYSSSLTPEEEQMVTSIAEEPSEELVQVR